MVDKFVPLAEAIADPTGSFALPPDAEDRIAHALEHIASRMDDILERLATFA